MSDLHSRITAALLREDQLRVCKLSDADIKFMADAVIRELCQEWRIDLGYDGYEFESDRAAAVERLQEIREDWGCDLPPTGVVLQRRYFTEWENDDE